MSFRPDAPDALEGMKLITAPRQFAWRVAIRFAKRSWTLPS